MARSHAKFYVRAWRDEEWRRLSLTAQWLYMALLSQPQLSLVGSLTLTPGRWSQLATMVTKTAVDAALGELVTTGKVLVDESTDELLIRAFTKNDLDPNRINVNLAKGLWGQWGCLDSHRLRVAAVDHMPDEVWEKLAKHAPPDAVDIRRSTRLEPESDFGFELEDPYPVRPSGSNFLPPPTSHLSTDTALRPERVSGNPQAVSNHAQVERLRSRFAVVDNPNPAESVAVSAACPPAAHGGVA